ncbi:MAG: hypothetical protein ACOY90_08830 [Candidatus Zhuqueibacterota bacterium]
MNYSQSRKTRATGKHREFKFIPRIINPVKIASVAIFSADEHIRQASRALKSSMPWVNIDILSNPAEANHYTASGPVVCICDDIALNFVNESELRKNNSDILLVLLSSNSKIHCSPPAVARQKFPYTAKADLVLAVDNSEITPSQILPSAVRCAEDRLNIEKYSKVKRYIFLIVDDEPRWFSQFLPVLYNIIGQRADVMTTRTYEETLQFLFGVSSESEIEDRNFTARGRGDDVVCLITDMYFPIGDRLKSDAGRDLFDLVQKYYQRIPVIIASKAEEGNSLKDIAFIMPKGDSGSLQTLKNYIHDFTGMGDFLIRDVDGECQYRVRNIEELYNLVVTADSDTPEAEKLRGILERYGRKDWFSTWLYMHGFRELGDKLRPRYDKGKRLITILKRHTRREILRMEFTPLLIEDTKIYNLYDLLNVLKTIHPSKIQLYSDNDYFSTWLDRKGYSELAEEFRPIHGSGRELGNTLAECVNKWIKIYESRGLKVM